MQARQGNCHVCGAQFEIRFRYQLQEDGKALCSQACQQARLMEEARCDVCGDSFALEYPYQVQVEADARRYVCSTDCRNARIRQTETGTPPRRIAVFNHKGGTGKTTTAVNLAAGLAETGRKVLLIDADGQGNVGASLGIRGERSLYHVLVQGVALEQAVVPVRRNMDVLTSNELVAAGELHLAGLNARDRVLRERLTPSTQGYDVVVLDCAPALSLMNQNALMYASHVLVPVSCDYLSLLGVTQVLKTLANVQRILKHRVELIGVLPTFFDVRNRIAREALETLQEHFESRCFVPIRVNTKLREAPRAKQTIFEYAPDSHGALDYQGLVDRVLEPVSLREAAASPSPGIQPAPAPAEHASYAVASQGTL